MHNPWVELPLRNPYILEMDCDSINRYTERVAEDEKINFRSIPEPFIGNPTSATVILLNLNPGDSPEDAKAHNDPAVRSAMIRNLGHELWDYAFYPLNPAFAWTPVAKWWTQRLRTLFDEGGLDRACVAQRLCVIEWFPYHSRKAGLPIKPVCPSQAYSFEIAQQMLGKKLVVGMRAEKRWSEVDQKFANIPYLKNHQCCHVSPGNTRGTLFSEIVDALRCGGCSQPEITKQSLPK
jgi:hypothetical protein